MSITIRTHTHAPRFTWPTITHFFLFSSGWSLFWCDSRWRFRWWCHNWISFRKIYFHFTCNEQWIFMTIELSFEQCAYVPACACTDGHKISVLCEVDMWCSRNDVFLSLCRPFICNGEKGDDATLSTTEIRMYDTEISELFGWWWWRRMLHHIAHCRRTHSHSHNNNNEKDD